MSRPNGHLCLTLPDQTVLTPRALKVEQEAIFALDDLNQWRPFTALDKLWADARDWSCAVPIEGASAVVVGAERRDVKRLTLSLGFEPNGVRRATASDSNEHGGSTLAFYRDGHWSWAHDPDYGDEALLIGPEWLFATLLPAPVSPPGNRSRLSALAERRAA